MRASAACVWMAFVVMLLAPAANAQNQTDYTIKKMEIAFDISADSQVKQTTSFVFSDVLDMDLLNYTLGEKAENIEISDGTQKLDFRLLPLGDGYNLQIFLKKPTDTLTIGYTLSDVIFVSESVKHFFTELSFGSIVENMSVSVRLPTGYGIYQNSYRPGDSVVGSDGKRITLAWQGSNISTPVLLSVKFIGLEENTVWVAVIFLIALIAILYFYFRIKTKEAFLHGFRTDEQTAINYLEKKKIALQSDLQHEFKFSRAKSTRIVERLEEKGLVKKVRYGRTNRLTWLK